MTHAWGLHTGHTHVGHSRFPRPPAPRLPLRRACTERVVIPAPRRQANDLYDRRVALSSLQVSLPDHTQTPACLKLGSG